jgi:hypothetical protein
MSTMADGDGAHATIGFRADIARTGGDDPFLASQPGAVRIRTALERDQQEAVRGRTARHE